jgi:putative CocE/NonD family hydrolase
MPTLSRPALLLAILCLPWAQIDVAQAQQAVAIRDKFEKREYQIPMRDGVKLFTAVYVPRDAGPDKKYPVMMLRTCYSVRPYGEEQYRSSLGPSRELQNDGYIFVYQDVRGTYMSEGKFLNMTPHRAVKKAAEDVDESSDTYDTVDWLVKNIPHNNGRVGMWGISYPGFYAAAGMIDHHPALVAVSPQAPIADWWYDDFHHHGAFFLPHAFNFLVRFGQPRPKPTTLSAPRFDHGTPDGYKFFLNLGAAGNANDRYLRDRIEFWSHLVAHPNYDQFWQSRNLLPHLKNVAPAVLIVGGWYDAEDLYGPLQIYRKVEADNPGIQNSLVMGPWPHGGWSRSDGDRLGNAAFGAKTSSFYRKWIEAKFFHSHLKGEGKPGLPEAYVFETGKNRWRQFDHWPPQATQAKQLYFAAKEQLRWEPPQEDDEACDEFISDPNRPVPFTDDVALGMTRAYMTDDQRFAARRPDVLVFQTDVLTEDITVCGPLLADLRVSTSRTDADWIVKLIDVFPDDAPDHEFVESGQHMGGYQMMVRSEVLRGRFRDSPSSPKPFEPDRPTTVKVPLQDVLHTFQAGHRIMIQVQSTWFPLVDRNPQKFVDNIFLADEQDYAIATHRVYRSVSLPSKIELQVLVD